MISTATTDDGAGDAPISAYPARTFWGTAKCRYAWATPAEHHFLVVLASWQRADGSSHPEAAKRRTVAQLAEQAGVGEATAYRAITKACAAGWLERSGHVSSGRRTVNSYRLRIPGEYDAARHWHQRQQRESDRAHALAVAPGRAPGSTPARPAASRSHVATPSIATEGTEVGTRSTIEHLPPYPPAEPDTSHSEPHRGEGQAILKRPEVAATVVSLCDRLTALPAATARSRSAATQRLGLAIAGLLERGWRPQDIVSVVATDPAPWPKTLNCPAGFVTYRLAALHELPPPHLARAEEARRRDHATPTRAAEEAARHDHDRLQKERAVEQHRWLAALDPPDRTGWWDALKRLATNAATRRYIDEERAAEPGNIPPQLVHLARSAADEAGLPTAGLPHSEVEDPFAALLLELG